MNKYIFRRGNREFGIYNSSSNPNQYTFTQWELIEHGI